MSKFQSEKSTKYSGIKELKYIEKFTPNYNLYIANLFKKYIHEKGKKNVLDFGAGIGTLSKIYLQKTKISPICVDIDQNNLEILRNNNFEALENLKSVNQNINAIFSSNVLEHIDDDISAINKIYDKLEFDGLFAIYLPAFNLLRSDLDEHVGHYRRYNRHDLISKIKNAGFIVEECFYCDCIGFFASLLMKITGFNLENGIGSPKSLKIYDNTIFPISNILDQMGLKYLFGKNIFLLARKK